MCASPLDNRRGMTSSTGVEQSSFFYRSFSTSPLTTRKVVTTNCRGSRRDAAATTNTNIKLLSSHTLKRIPGDPCSLCHLQRVLCGSYVRVCGCVLGECVTHTFEHLCTTICQARRRKTFPRLARDTRARSNTRVVSYRFFLLLRHLVVVDLIHSHRYVVAHQLHAVRSSTTHNGVI